MLADWRRRRRERRAKQEAVRRQLAAEYLEKLASRDPDALESARDYGDNDLIPRRTEVSMARFGLGLVVLFLCVVVLAVFFGVIKHLTGG